MKPLDISEIGPPIYINGPPAAKPYFRTDQLKSAFTLTGASIATLGLQLCAHDDPELVKKLAPFERNFAVVRGWLQIVDLAVKTILLSILLNCITADGAVGNVWMAMVLASYLAAVDHLTFVRAPLLGVGIRALADAGLWVSLPSANDKRSKWTKRLRIATSIVTALVLSFAVGLKYDRAAIDQRMQEDFLADNQANYQTINRDLDAKRKQAENAVSAAQRLLKASRDYSPQRVGQVQAELARRQGALEQLKAGRPDATNQLLKKEPNFIPKDDSFFGSIKAFLEVLWANPLAALPIIGIDLIALSLDLMTATLSLVYIPSVYAAELVRRQLEGVTQAARAAASTLKPGGAPPPLPVDPPEPPSPAAPAAAMAAAPKPSDLDLRGVAPYATSNMNGSAPPRRGRGRPKGSTSKPKALATESGHG
jgi:hypothetical protein